MTEYEHRTVDALEGIRAALEALHRFQIGMIEEYLERPMRGAVEAVADEAADEAKPAQRRVDAIRSIVDRALRKTP